MKINKNLVKGSFILLAAYNIFNFLNFVFHFSMVRLMTIADYGVLVSLFTITYILAVFSESIQIVMTKYSANENSSGRLKNLLKKSLKKALIVSSAVFVVYVIASLFFSKLLDIEYTLMLLNGVIIFSIFFAPVTRGILQGGKRFRTLGGNMIIEAVIKLLLAIFFVYIGWRVYGALLGTIIGMAIAIMLSFLSLKNVIKSKEESADTEGIYGYTKPTFIIMLVVLIFYSVDVLIAKIFFSAEIAGVYAVASILAKTIFFGTQPVSRAMFPITAENNSREKPNNAFMNALGILLAMIFVALILFYFFPEFIVRVYSGRAIIESAEILFYLGLAVSLVSFANLVLLYKLSLGKIKNAWYFLVFLIVEVVLLSVFSKNLLQFSIAFLTSAAIFLWGAIFLTRR